MLFWSTFGLFVPVLPQICQFGGFLWHLLGQVVHLGGIGFEVVEFPDLPRTDHFQVALANGVGPIESPIDFMVYFSFFTLENG